MFDATDEVLHIPGLPPMHDYERQPQEVSHLGPI